ncbi:acetone carboxylase subunit gamma [Aneurinibacillus danicus]|jgi:acetone carboxylase gamma subunit|uniref:Acetone carboxylase subunit gamma n=1 Tax=Aneurinibacillus danicus TaxID=267746 RepID=A0A511VDL5_9BACL|nr:acetone carboxylase subunit gamma [Aneurinibacillus danicus]GEN35352.1 acetone carboxylase subunit gamma [Aneurinibacillus danicus]
MPTYERKMIEELVDGKLSFRQVHKILSSFKDADRFDQYVSILQERVPYDDKIIMPYGLHLNIVAKETGERIVKCDCGHEFCEYTTNWKLFANVYVRDTEEKIMEVYPKFMGCDPKWMHLREFYCPSCFTMLEVEAVPPGYPFIFDFQPDIEAYYENWLNRPVPTP